MELQKLDNAYFCNSLNMNTKRMFELYLNGGRKFNGSLTTIKMISDLGNVLYKHSATILKKMQSTEDVST
jgi:hypothetical protein